MPGKGHRVASHQARLGQRRHRTARGATTPLEGKTDVQTIDPERPGDPALPVHPAPIATPAHRGRGEPRRTVVEFIAPELKRIGAIAGVAFVLLVILSFVLG